MTEKVSLSPAVQDPLHMSAGGLCPSCPGLSWAKVWGWGGGVGGAYGLLALKTLGGRKLLGKSQLPRGSEAVCVHVSVCPLLCVGVPMTYM